MRIDRCRVMAGIVVASGLALVGCGRAAAPDRPDAPAGALDAPNPPRDSAPADAAFAMTLDGNRDRLLVSYLARLQSIPDTMQSNGLVGRDLASVCALWSKLDPSSRNVFLTLTHRLDGSSLRDGSRMLDHVTRLYRVTGGQGGSATSAGSCGGGEYNRMILSMDAALHDAQVAANAHQGAVQPDNKRDLADIPTSSYWRDSHDVGGPHGPFDASDETNAGAPRGQTQYFRDPASAVANAPLGRMDVTTVVDPLALEMDQDYDCVHNSNPSCTYVFYGPACAPQSSLPGVQIYAQDYGDFEASWKPSGC